MCIVLLSQIAKDSLLTCEYYFFYGGEYKGDRAVLFHRYRASFFFLFFFFIYCLRLFEVYGSLASQVAQEVEVQE